MVNSLLLSAQDEIMSGFTPERSPLCVLTVVNPSERGVCELLMRTYTLERSPMPVASPGVESASLPLGTVTSIRGSISERACNLLSKVSFVRAFFVVVVYIFS